LDAYPALSLPVAYRDYFQITPFAGVRSLVWKRDDHGQDGLSKDDHLEHYTAGVTVSSEVQRIFAVGGKKLEKLRHAIRPEVTYLYSPSVKQDHLPNFVSSATQQNTVNSTLSQLLNMQNSATTPAVAGDQHAVMYSLTNTLMARVKDQKGGKRYLDLLRFKVAQFYDIREAGKDMVSAGTDRRPLGDVNAELDITPVQNVTFNARNRYNVYGNGWTQENYDLSLNDSRGDTVSVNYRYTQNSIKETNLIFKAVVTKALDLTFRIKRDHFNERDIEKLYGFTSRQQCWTFGFDYGDSSTDRVFAFRFGLHGF
jgi:LPS-assembly protein